MNLIPHLENQLAARGLEPLSFEQIDLLESENPADADEREWVLADLRDRLGLDIPAECFSVVTDEERSNGRISR
jgi:hypothetical protein